MHFSDLKKHLKKNVTNYCKTKRRGGGAGSKAILSYHKKSSQASLVINPSPMMMRQCQLLWNMIIVITFLKQLPLARDPRNSCCRIAAWIPAEAVWHATVLQSVWWKSGSWWCWQIYPRYYLLLNELLFKKITLYLHYHQHGFVKTLSRYIVINNHQTSSPLPS